MSIYKHKSITKKPGCRKEDKKGEPDDWIDDSWGGYG